MKIKSLIPLIILFVIILLGSYILYNYLVKNYKEDSKDITTIIETDKTESKIKAKDIEITDMDGNKVMLFDYKGKPIVINFWASWCGPCKSEMPEFQTAFEEYGDKIQFVMLNLTDGSQETEETAKEFIKEEKFTFPVFFDKELEGASLYNIYSIPETYFIDKDGNIKHQVKGSMDLEALKKGLDKIK